MKLYRTQRDIIEQEEKMQSKSKWEYVPIVKAKVREEKAKSRYTSSSALSSVSLTP
jgi:hypothetical protein